MCSEHRNIFSSLYNNMEDNVLLSKQPRALRDCIVRARLAQALGCGAEATSCQHPAVPAVGAAAPGPRAPRRAAPPRTPRKHALRAPPSGLCRSFVAPWPTRTGRPPTTAVTTSLEATEGGAPSLLTAARSQDTRGGGGGGHGTGLSAAHWRLPHLPGGLFWFWEGPRAGGRAAGGRRHRRGGKSPLFREARAVASVSGTSARTELGMRRATFSPARGKAGAPEVCARPEKSRRDQDVVGPLRQRKAKLSGVKCASGAVKTRCFSPLFSHSWNAPFRRAREACASRPPDLLPAWALRGKPPGWQRAPPHLPRRVDGPLAFPGHSPTGTREPSS